MTGVNDSQTRLVGGIAQMTASHGYWTANDARIQCGLETDRAVQAGREFTRVYWYYVDGNPVLTLWDMNDLAKP